MAPIKTILHITPFFPPNIGGVETHLHDLTTILNQKNYRQIILTYSPLSTNVPYQKIEDNHNLYIRRFYLYGHNLFHKLEKHPLLNLTYITPYLLFRSIIWILIHRPKIDTIHSHGLNAAIIGIIIQKIFQIPNHITSIYSTYDNVPLNSFGTKFMVYILNHVNHILTQSNQSVEQLICIGVIKDNISRYYHWIDLNRFKPISKTSKIFSILFIGRLIPAKNALTLAKIAANFPKIIFNFVGTGPDYDSLKQLSQKYSNIQLQGDVPYSKLHQYYQSNSLFCLPSKYHEGWGRVLAESVSCGTPVITTNLGGTTEAVDDKVAIITTPTVNNFTSAIKKLTTNSKEYLRLKNNCRHFALSHYSPTNIKYIIKYY